MKTDAKHVLFLDFDGVLHPDAVYLSRKGPALQAQGELFMWAPCLAEILEFFPSVSLVLSTSWVRHLGFKRAVSHLTPVLAARVIGATWHSSMARGWADENVWDGRFRYEQISRYASRATLAQWVALDDDAEGWAENSQSRLVRCNPSAGISEAVTQQLLRQRLEALVRKS